MNRPLLLPSLFLSLSAVVTAVVGCAGSGRRETSALAVAVDLYRRADDASRAQRVAAIAKVDCSDPAVCQAKGACLAAAEPTARALALKTEVTLRLADIEGHRLAPDDPEAQALPDKLDEASRLLVAGRAKMTECEKALADLRLKYGA